MALFTGPTGPFGWQYLAHDRTAAAAASVTFVDPSHFSTDYVAHRIEYFHVVPATDDTELYLKLSNDAGGTWEGGTVYSTEVEVNLGGTVTFDTSAGAAQFTIAGEATAGDGLDNTATTGGASGVVTLDGLSQTTDVIHLDGMGSYVQAAGAATAKILCTGIYETIEAVDGIQLIMGSGNVAAGSIFVLMGLRLPPA